MPTLFALALLPAATPAAGAVEAHYTDLDLDACEVTEIYEEGVGAELACEGLDGVPVFVTEGDLRFDVDFGVKDEDYDSFMPFNAPGRRIEWRVDDAGPFAAILRFSIEHPAGTPEASRKGSVLAVHKVGAGETRGCPIAYVDALENGNANLIARQVADAFARSFRCGEDRATYVGAVGELSGWATATRRER